MTPPLSPSSVTIILLNWNGFRYTDACLTSLEQLPQPHPHIIVVDNHSAGKDVQLLKQRWGRSITVIRNPQNLGFAGGNNVGARAALRDPSCRAVLFLNNDTVIQPNFLEELLKVANSSAKIGIIGPKISSASEPQKLLFVGGKIRRYLGEAPHLGLFQKDGSRWQKVRDVDYIEGSCLLIKRKVIEEVGLFDENFFAYWEDVDLCQRAREKGFRCVVAPQAMIQHHVSAATGGDRSPRSIYYIERNRFRFMRKLGRWNHWPSFLLFLIARGSLFFLETIRHNQGPQRRAFVRGIIDGFRGIAGACPKNLE